jgi:NTP pyrophosphatase (non-canonical NTP hydrolase)
MKNIDLYQKRCADTDSSTRCTKPAYLYYVLGMCGETGELTERIKKLMRNKKGKVDAEFVDGLKGELGDIMWYVSRLAAQFDIKMSSVTKCNLKKLKSRKQRGVIKSQGDNR